MFSLKEVELLSQPKVNNAVMPSHQLEMLMMNKNSVLEALKKLINTDENKDVDLNEELMMI